MLREGHDREIAVAGDSRVPGIPMLAHSGTAKLAVNAGILHTGSVYAKRYFSLRAATAIPVIELGPDAQRFTAYWTLGHWRASRLTA